MGKTKTFKYRIALTNWPNFGSLYTCGSNKKVNTEVFANEMCVSTMTGFANEHIGKKFGIRLADSAFLQNNKTREYLGYWYAPKFSIMPNPKDYPQVAKI